jgi:Ni,Fe-hydrogenase III small subunit/NAD-dependent dihydropyrimidine dehydrogenase PreA subunit
MLEWLLRGLRKRPVTTRYPSRPEQMPDRLRSRITVSASPGAVELDRPLTALCPTGAIVVDDDQVTVDRGRCILCGLCVERAPAHFAFEPVIETASRRREALWAPENPVFDLDELRQPLADQATALRRSIHIRHVDAGSDGAEEWEIAALTNPYYDMQRLGFFFTAAPRHADILLVSGVVTDQMREPLLRAWDAMPAPKTVVAVGTDACSGGLAAASIGARGVSSVLPVDVFVPGSPPQPLAILHGLLLAVGLIEEQGVRR